MFVNLFRSSERWGSQRPDFLKAHHLLWRLFLLLDRHSNRRRRIDSSPHFIRKLRGREMMQDNSVHGSPHLEILSQSYRNVLRGSKASRTASPMKISSDSMMATAKNPVKPSHGA